MVRRRHPGHEIPTLFTEIGTGRLSHMKEALDGQMAATYSLNTTWVGVTTTISQKVFAAFWQWYEYCKKCTKLKGNYAENSYELK